MNPNLMGIWDLGVMMELKLYDLIVGFIHEIYGCWKLLCLDGALMEFGEWVRF